MVEPAHDVAEFVERVAKTLAEHPDAVQVLCHGHDSLALGLVVAPEDRGRFIGRRGRTANALRALTGLVAAQLGQGHIALQVL